MIKDNECLPTYSGVATYFTGNAGDKGNSSEGQSTHEIASLNYVAERIAALLACPFLGEYRLNSSEKKSGVFYVPNNTLLAEEADMLGIGGTAKIFGGCVPYAFVAQKCVTHILVNDSSISPLGWSTQFGESVRHVTLRGFSAFSKGDAMVAAEKLLPHGELRIKSPCSRGGHGQAVVDNIDGVEDFLRDIDSENFRTHGVVLESNLNRETTRSIGTVIIGNTQISYCGSQTTTKDSQGKSVYGGSTLRAVRGNFNDLLELEWTKDDVIAIAQAMIYDFAAARHFQGFFASRRNYDVAQGYDREDQFCSGVLEQSWRIGGASPAEIAAVEAFSNQSELKAVQTSCREIHSISDVPENATVYFRGTDPDVGHITKFVQIDAHEYGDSSR